MKNTMYRGWKIYKTGSGRNKIPTLNANHPLKGTKLFAALPDNGDTRHALAWIKRDIDAMETLNPTK